MEELVKNQQPNVINNSITNNINNITNIQINIFLNNECKNACNLEDFLNKIDFKKVNYNNILTNYLDGNMVVMKRNLDELPEFERPVYCLVGDEGKVYIKHKNGWIMEVKKDWENQIEREQNEIDDEPVANCMYYYLIR